MTLHKISKCYLVCRHVAKTQPPAPHCRANGEQLPYLAKHNRLTLLTGAAGEEGLSLERENYRAVWGQVFNSVSQSLSRERWHWIRLTEAPAPFSLWSASQILLNNVCGAFHRQGLDMLVKPCMATLLQFSDGVTEREGNQDDENHIMVYDTKRWKNSTITLLSEALPVPETSKCIPSTYNCINSHENYDPSIKM